MPINQEKAAAVAKHVADQKIAADSKRVADEKAFADAKRVADEKAAADAKHVADQKAAADFKRVADEKEKKATEVALQQVWRNYCASRFFLNNAVLYCYGYYHLYIVVFVVYS